MQLHNFIATYLILVTSLTSALSLPNPQPDTSLAPRNLQHPTESRTHPRDAYPEIFADLEKRAGTGGKGGGSSSGGKGGSSGSDGDGSTSGSSGTSGNSNTGGRSGTGAGVRPTYGGTFYLGGSRTPYASGARSPGGIAPYLLIGGGLGFWAGAHPWGAYGVYSYPFPGNVSYYNETSGQNVTVPAKCLCRRYAECGCDANVNGTWVQGVVGNGSYVNRDTVQLAQVNGTSTLVMDGTLDNGTEAADDGTSSSSTSTTTTTGGAGRRDVWGWGVVAAAVACGVLVL